MKKLTFIALASALACVAAGVFTRQEDAIPAPSSSIKPVSLQSDCPPLAAPVKKYSRGHWEWVLGKVPGAKPGSYSELSRLVNRSEWDALSPIQRGMLRTRVASAHAGAPVSVTCFAPGTDTRIVQAFRRVENAISNYRPSNRWTNTASGTVNQGGPMTLTWNLVTDGTSIAPIESGASATTSNLRAYAVSAYGSESNFRAQLRTVFSRYEELTGIRFVEVNYDDGSTLPNQGSLNVRADIRIGGTPIDGNGNVLAYNYFPNFSDMVLDTTDSFLTNVVTPQNPNPLRLLRNTVSHEHGHGLGLDHVCPVNETKLMEPFVSLSFEGPQLDDIQAYQNFYGDTNESPAPNNSSGAATNLGTLGIESKTIDTVSISHNGDTDFFKFQTSATNRKLVGTLSIPFSSYLEGAQNGDGSCSAGTTFNPNTVRNLGLRVLNNSGTVLAEANTQAAGGTETVTIDSLTGTGPFFVQVFSSDAINAAQLYRLNLTFSAGTTASTHTVSGRCLTIFPNGAFNGSERTGLQDVTVTLKNSEGTTIGTKVSDANGNYSFTGVADGNYTAVATFLRGGNSLITLNPVTNPFTVNGADVTLTRFATFAVFGTIRGPDTAGNLQLLSGATVEILNPQNQVIGTKVTGSDGRYQFRNMRAANFTLRVTRSGFTFANRAVTTPSSGLAWSPITRANINGTRNAAAVKSPSGKTF